MTFDPESQAILTEMRTVIGTSRASLLGQALMEATTRLLVQRLRDCGINTVCLDDLDLEDVHMGFGVKVWKA